MKFKSVTIQMKVRHYNVIKKCFCLAFAATISVQSTIPCGSVFKQGQEADIFKEQAFILWQPDLKQETFIRKAWFKGEGTDFGFIVPTPSEPTLAEVSDGLFSQLTYSVNSRLNPPTSNATKSRAGSGGFGGGGGGVVVVKEQNVAGMKATILRASDLNALRDWLSQNDYPANPSVIRWAESYVKSNFYLTAFKIDRKQDSEQLNTTSVKMIFKTPQPFYPYREPIAPRKSGMTRSLEVFFMSSEDYFAQYTNRFKNWDARKIAFKDLKRSEITNIAEQAKLSPTVLEQNPVLTYFRDSTMVRPDEDVVFLPNH